MMTSYLQRRGKRRYCDKSLGAAQHAGLLLKIWPRDPVHLPVPASDGRHRVRHRGVTVGPDQLRVRAVHRQPARQQRGRAGPVLARLHDVDRRGRGALHRPLPAGQVRGPGHRPGRPDRADLRVHRRGAGTRDRGAAASAPATSGSAPATTRSGTPAGSAPTRSAGAGRCRPERSPRRYSRRVNELADVLGYVQVGEQWGTGAKPADLRARRERPPADGGPAADGTRPGTAAPADAARPGAGDAAGLGGRGRRAGPGGAGAGRRAVRADARVPREGIGPAVRERARLGRRGRLVAARPGGGHGHGGPGRGRGRPPTGRSPDPPRRGTACWPARPTWASPSAGATCATPTRATPGPGRWAPTAGSPP